MEKNGEIGNQQQLKGMNTWVFAGGADQAALPPMVQNVRTYFESKGANVNYNTLPYY